MDVRFAFLCSGVTRDEDGRLDARFVGLDTLHVPDLSLPAPPFSMVFQLQPGSGDGDEIGLQFSISNFDGFSLDYGSGQASFRRDAAGFLPQTLTMTFIGVRFPAHTLYTVHVSTDTQSLIDIPLYIIP